MIYISEGEYIFVFCTLYYSFIQEISQHPSKTIDNLNELQRVNDPMHILQTSHIVIHNNNDNNLFMLYKTMHDFNARRARLKMSKWNYIKLKWDKIFISCWIQQVKQIMNTLWDEYKFNHDVKMTTSVIHNKQKDEYRLFILAIKINGKSTDENLFINLQLTSAKEEEEEEEDMKPNLELTSITAMKPNINDNILLIAISQFKTQLIGLAYDTKNMIFYYVKYQKNKFKILSQIPCMQTPSLDSFIFLITSSYIMLWNSFITINIYQLNHKSNKNKRQNDMMICSKMFTENIPIAIQKSEAINCCFIGGNVIIFFADIIDYHDSLNIYLYFIKTGEWQKSNYSFLHRQKKWYLNLKLNLKINVLRNEQREKETIQAYIGDFERKNHQDEITKIPLVLYGSIGSFYCIEKISLMNFNRFNSFDKFHLFSWRFDVDDLFY